MAKRLHFEMGGNEDDYVRQCMKCQHSYTKKMRVIHYFAHSKSAVLKKRKTKRIRQIEKGKTMKTAEIILHTHHPDYCKECIYHDDKCAGCLSEEYRKNSYKVNCVWRYCKYKRKKVQ